MLTRESLPEIETALAREGRALGFPSPLESAYHAQRHRQHTVTTRRFLLLVAASNLVGFILDVQNHIPGTGLSLTLRVGLSLPIALFSIFLLGRSLPGWLYGLAAVSPMVSSTILDGILARSTGGVLQGDIMILPALTIFAQTLIAPVPFRIALRGLLVALVSYALVSLLPWPGHFFPPVRSDGPTFTCAIGFAALYERYRRERADRKDFLLCEANRIRMESILAANAHLERLSSMDGLTGVFNRRYLDAALARLWQVARSHERWIGILMVDIDRFKLLNDTSGHQHGDFCLERVAQLLQANVRAGVDTVARYGGEEFVAILPDADESEVVVIGERVRQAIEDACLPAPHGAVVTISAGAAAVRGDSTLQLTLEELIATADQALYEAKKSGRNRVIFSAPALQDA